MTDQLPPQWAVDKADIALRQLECSLSHYARKTATAKLARLLAEERERCANLCDEESHRLGKFNTRDGDAMSLCAMQMAMKIREL